MGWIALTAKVWHDDVNDDAAAILPNPMIEPLPGTNHRPRDTTLDSGGKRDNTILHA